MAVESDADLAAFFCQDEFGAPLRAHTAGGVVSFDGILTTGHVTEQPGTTAEISSMTPRIIARRAPLAGLAQGDEIELPGGRRVYVNDVHYKGEIVIIHYHDHW